MFTGIIQCTAKILAIEEKRNFRTHFIKMPKAILYRISVGSSVAHNGCCLTVSKIIDDLVSFDLIKETLRITNLGELKLGDIVNIESAAKFSDEIGGHMLSGHIMTTATISKIIISENNHQIWFQLHDIMQMKYVSYKGFIAIDGISLTIGEVTKTRFSVNFIPETLTRTIFKFKRLGDKVNIEFDTHTKIIVETVERILKQREKFI